MSPKLLFSEEGHSYFLEDDDTGDWWSIPSVSHVVRSMGCSSDFSQVNEFVLENARIRGIALHEYIEQWLTDSLDHTTIDPDYEPLFESFLGWYEELEEKGIELTNLKVEEMVWRDYCGIQVAGRVDLQADIVDSVDGEVTKVIFDWKSRDRMYPTDTIQLSAYADMITETRMVEPHLILLRKDGKPAKDKKIVPNIQGWIFLVRGFNYKIELGIEKEYKNHYTEDNP